MSSSLKQEVAARLRRTPMSELSWPRKVRRVFGFMLFLSSLAMAVSASTASTDWELHSDGTQGERASEDRSKSPTG